MEGQTPNPNFLDPTQILNSSLDDQVMLYRLIVDNIQWKMTSNGR